MKIDKSMPIKCAFLHQAITIPGSGLGSEKSLNHSRIPGLKMYLVTSGMILELKGIQAFVPHANVACAVMEEEEVKDAKKG